jgi:epsilon-lactone hydrolase
VTNSCRTQFGFIVRLRAVGIEAELHVFEAFGHAGFLGTAPEDAERRREVRRFVREHFGD